MKFLYHPDTVLTAADLETLALDLLAEIPIPGVEGCGFDSGIIRQTLLQAAVDQKSIKAVTDTTLGTYSDDYTLAQLHTAPPDELEAVVNTLFAQQAAISTTMAVHMPMTVNSVTRNHAMAPASAIATSLDSFSVVRNHSGRGKLSL
ncbi:hypothetical protein [Halogeometricum borinquense]|uniref:hypothetical protein n=1 Tax=Halogeometricum borinquense TaxID=60847 RepID=UPI001A930F71|nr:hypothetical protein [Halogeometricum borinquense]